MRRTRDIQATEDFVRVRDLPRREIDRALGQRYADEITARFRRPGSSAALNWKQGLALYEASQVRGLVAWLPVGIGKTWISELIPSVCGYDGHPTCLIVSGRTLADKAAHERREMRKDWRLPSPPPVTITMQALAREDHADWFMRVKPRVIVIDESDDHANASASVSRRITRYLMWAEENGIEVIVVCLTGTPTRLSIMSFWHQLVWCLGTGAPVPLDEREAERWASVVDEPGARARKPMGGRGGCMPGVLGHDFESARAWFAARLRDTPGLVRVDEDSAPSVGLTIRQVYANECPRLDQAFGTFLQFGELPGGAELITDPLSRYRIDAQLGTGFYHRFKDPQPPEAWRDARRAAAAFVADAIEASTHTRDPIDTEAQVYRRFPDAPALAAWLEIEPTYTPRTEPCWLSTATIETVIEWLEAEPEPSIVWTGSGEFLEACRAATGLRAYGPRGRDVAAPERSILTAPRDQSMLVSWHANKKGLNLQPWGRMLITHPPQSAKWIEQIVGRAHRQGRKGGVHVDILMGSGGTCAAFDRMFEEARFARDIALTQKILRARVEREEPPRITQSNRFRWAGAAATARKAS
jgi:hypothetical protein